MKNIITIISKFILVIAFLNGFAFLVLYVGEGRDIGIFTKPVKEFAQFPRLVKDVILETKSSSRLVNIDPDFHPSNYLEYDVFTMNAHYDSSRWITSLTNLKNDSIIYRWYLKEDNHLPTKDRMFSRAQPIGPILLADRSVIIQNQSTFNLFRLDRESKIMWHNTDHIFHHSMNLDVEGNIWTCTRKIIKVPENKDSQFYDDYITKIDVATGKTIYNKSVREILIDNDLGFLVYGTQNQEFVANQLLDPFHLNDVEPVLKDGPHWQAGDLFFSLRHRSTVLLYRPSTNQVLRVIKGPSFKEHPFYYQHDVDIKSDSTITIFNNNVSSAFPRRIITDDSITKLQPLPNPLFNKISEVLEYNFIDSTFTSVYHNQFVENKIKTETQGLQHILSNGDMFVESQNEGKVYIFNENEVLLKKYSNEVINNRVELPHWTRIYENINF
jgi:hypothetical protein